MEGIIMSKWRKPLKNQRRFDARYFLNERMESEGAEENSVQQEKLKKDFSDFSFDSWLAEAAVALEEEDASYGEALEEEEDHMAKYFDPRDPNYIGDRYTTHKPGSKKQARVDAASLAKLSKIQTAVDAEDEKAAQAKADRRVHLDKVAAVAREPKGAWRRRQNDKLDAEEARAKGIKKES